MSTNLCSDFFSYIVVYRASVEVGTIAAEKEQKEPLKNHTKINCFDKDALSTLPALWYCLHLPRDFYDLQNVSRDALRALNGLERPQRILSWRADDELDSEGLRYLRSCHPILILAEDRLSAEANQLKLALSVKLEVTYFSQLSQGSLAAHWHDIASLYDLADEPLASAAVIFEEVSLPVTLLSGVHMARRLDLVGHLKKLEYQSSVIDKIREIFKLYPVASALGRMAEESENPDYADSIFQRYYEEEAQVARPVTLLSLGISRVLERTTYGKNESRSTYDHSKGLVWNSMGWQENDAAIENYVASILMNHRAVASSGVGLRIEDSTTAMFNLLDCLEMHCKESEQPKPSKVWKLLKQIGEVAANAIGEDGQNLVKHSSRLTIFSDFPLGLAIFPDHTTPVMFSVPITYRPLTPLTLSLQIEMWSTSVTYWGDGIRILVAECLDTNDKIHKASARGWNYIKETLKPLPDTIFTIAQIDSVDELNVALARDDYDILVISAHGFYDREKNEAGIIIGGHRYVDIRLSKVPRLIILSSCHVSPRGINAVSIADILLRRGARAVIGTLIPINVFHNAQLMLRLFVNLRLTITGELSFYHFLDLWNFVVYSNAVHDVLNANRSMMKWGLSKFQGKPVEQEFKENRSRGRLRKNHIYDDTIKILREIAQDCGFAEKFDSIINSTGFFPETIFYQIIGWPEQIILNDKRLKAS